MKLVAAGALVILLSSCQQSVIDNATNDIPPSVASYDLTNADIKAVEKGVRVSLKDPNSAQFGNMMAMKRSDGMIAVCGYVNGKNSFGGYVGMTPFMGLLDHSPAPSFGVAGMGGDDIETQVTLAFCRKAGIYL